MRIFIFFFFGFLLSSTHSFGSVDADSMKLNWDSTDKLHHELNTKSADAKSKIDEANKRINETQDAHGGHQNKKPNYWMPITTGAVLGIVLALWLKRKKRKS